MSEDSIIADSKISVELLENSIEYIVKKRKKIKDLLVGYSLIVGQASRLSMQMWGFDSSNPFRVGLIRPLQEIRKKRKRQLTRYKYWIECR